MSMSCRTAPIYVVEVQQGQDGAVRQEAHRGSTLSEATEAGEPVRIEFEYARGAVYKIKPSDKMDLERAKALTIRYGRCIVCGRKLKARVSVEQGIGPVCIKSFR